MVSTFQICYCLSFGLSLCAFFAEIYAFKRLKLKFLLLPKALKLYLLVCALPFVLAINVSSIYSAITFLIYNYESNFTIEIARTIVSFSSSQIRNSLFFVIIERIIATLFFGKYKLSSKLTLFWWLTIYTFVISAFYTTFSAMTLYYPPLQIYKLLTLWIMFSIHFLTLIVCIVLHYSNLLMYRKYAYQTNLQQRYQIYENIKVLSYIFPPILIYTTITPFSSIVTIICTNIFFYNPPYCTFHIFYHLSFLFIITQQIYIKSLTNAIAPKMNTTTVVNPFGKNLPANVTSEKYFEDLHKQWN